MRVWTQDYIGGIRKAYEEDWYASTVRERQMACALYFIDKLALRAGHEKDEDEADTVGCCTLKVQRLKHLGFGHPYLRACIMHSSLSLWTSPASHAPQRGRHCLLLHSNVSLSRHVIELIDPCGYSVLHPP